MSKNVFHVDSPSRASFLAADFAPGASITSASPDYVARNGVDNKQKLTDHSAARRQTASRSLFQEAFTLATDFGGKQLVAEKILCHNHSTDIPRMNPWNGANASTLPGSREAIDGLCRFPGGPASSTVQNEL